MNNNCFSLKTLRNRQKNELKTLTKTYTTTVLALKTLRKQIEK